GFTLTPHILSDSMYFTRHIINDTIPCIMLVGDTSVKELTPKYPISTELGDTLYIGGISTIDPMVRWMKGFIVRNRGFIYSIEYLDKYKAPLDKNIIVWMAKDLPALRSF